MLPVMTSLPIAADYSAKAGPAPEGAPRRTGEGLGLVTRALPLLFLLGLLPLGGCGGSKLPPLVPVKGKVTVNDKPLAGGSVTLQSLDPQKAKELPPSIGQISESGDYEIRTEGKEGAPEGKYRAVVNPSMMPAPGTKKMEFPFDQKYSNLNTSTLALEVVPNAAPGAYDLKLTK